MAAHAGTMFLFAAAFVLIIVPAAGLIRHLRALPRPQSAVERVDPFREWIGVVALGQMVLWCVLVGVLAAGLALVWAWWMRGLPRRARPWAMGVGLSPLLLPSYLAYAGWNLLRAPGTWLGDALAVAPVSIAANAWRAFALVGLTLWVWPLALLVLAPAAARLPRSVLEAMGADGAPPRVVLLHVVRMLWRDIARAAVLCALVMAGSAIPLHVAQVYTYSIWLWSEMNRVPDLRGVWLASWPLLAVAVAGAVFVLRLVPGASRDDGGADEWADGVAEVETRGQVQRGVWVVLTACAAALWACSVLVPLLLFVLSVREVSAFAEFWRQSGAAVWQSAHAAAWTGGVGALVLLAAWVSVSGVRSAEGRRSVSQVVLLLTVVGLVPGVLVGSAYALAAPASGLPLVVLTHLARFAFVGAIIGWWLGASEPADLRDARELDGGATFRGWLLACVRPRWAAVLGAAVAMAMLSLHEIESTVQVLPPGLDNLAQFLLDQLHYLRQDQLAAAGASMAAAGLLGAVAGGVLLAKARTGESERS
ncbi:MAG: hypothetical protein KF699_03985 [Phycisphaeraceae bacterium]|nr:hypothetical protein [Phycisphaeraceae bacterium]